MLEYHPHKEKSVTRACLKGQVVFSDAAGPLLYFDYYAFTISVSHSVHCHKICCSAGPSITAHDCSLRVRHS